VSSLCFVPTIVSCGLIGIASPGGVVWNTAPCQFDGRSGYAPVIKLYNRYCTTKSLGPYRRTAPAWSTVPLAYLACTYIYAVSTLS
jgi:hypothetical protein